MGKPIKTCVVVAATFAGLVLAIVGCLSVRETPYADRLATRDASVDALRRDTARLQAQTAGSAHGAEGLAAGGQTSPTAPAADPDRAGGMIIYNATMNVVVERIAECLEKVRATAVSMGGYLQEMGPDAIVVKVPAQKFQAALDAVGKLGEVTLKEVKGADVSETMRDLAVRLKNAEEVRARLAKMLENAAAMDDALKIEKELERVTETIELTKGKIRYLENGVAFSTLTVRLNSPVPQTVPAEPLPFPWVESLASELAQGTQREAGWAGRSGRGVDFELPEGYVKYYEGDDLTRAMSADGVKVRVEMRENHEGGTAEFWARLIRRVLVERRAVPAKEEAALKLKTGAEARVLAGGKQVAGKEAGYLLAVVSDRRQKRLCTFEAWGPRECLAADRAKIEKAIESLRVK
jgi:hypothetical protein